jgi:hypothetical protein
MSLLAGGIRHDDPSYSHGVRQELHKRFGNGRHPNVTIHEGRFDNYSAAVRGSKYCLAPSGHGWGIRLSQYMLQGCVPVIIQVGLICGSVSISKLHDLHVAVLLMGECWFAAWDGVVLKLFNSCVDQCFCAGLRVLSGTFWPWLGHPVVAVYAAGRVPVIMQVGLTCGSVSTVSLTCMIGMWLYC